MIVKELTELVELGVNKIKKSKGLNMHLSKVVEKEDLVDYEILYDVKDSAKIEKITLSFHIQPLPEFDFDAFGVSIGKTIIKRIYTEVKLIDEIERERNS